GNERAERNGEGEDEREAAFHASPLTRRSPHSPMKQPSAKRKSTGVCQSGNDQVSVIGIFFEGRSRTKLSSSSGATMRPPVSFASRSSASRPTERSPNSSRAKSALQPAAEVPSSTPVSSV